MDLRAIKGKIRSGQPVTHDELVWAIRQDKHLLFNMLMDNNLACVNQVMRMELGQKSLPFAPDRKAIEATINSWIVKNDIEDLNHLIRSFKFNPDAQNYTTNERFLSKLKFQLK